MKEQYWKDLIKEVKNMSDADFIKEVKKLKPVFSPCPFCTATEELGIGHKSNTNYYVFCGYCGAKGPEAPNKEDAIAKWNKRKLYEITSTNRSL